MVDHMGDRRQLQYSTRHDGEVFGSTPKTPSSARRAVCFSLAAYALSVIHHLRKCNVQIAHGLSDKELHYVESECRFTFPPDLRAILQEGVPIGDGFPNWRAVKSEELRSKLKAPALGLCHEAALGSLWVSQWGARPADAPDRLRIIRSALEKAPILVPIYDHCYIPSSPNVAGNPILFVHQGEAFYCGYDVADFFERESFSSSAHHNPSSFGATRRLITQKKLTKNSCDYFPPVNVSTIAEMVRSECQENEGKMSMNLVRIGDKSKDLEAMRHGLKPLNITNTGRMKEAGFSCNKNGADHSISTTIGRLTSADKNLRSSVGRSLLHKKSFVPECITFLDNRNNTLVDITMAATHAWVAKTSRKIEFWSDIVDNKRIVRKLEECKSSNVDHKVQTVPLKVEEEQEDDHDDEDDEVNPYKENKEKLLAAQQNSEWLQGYLELMAGRLRRGGWNEAEILEMLNSNS